MGKPRREARCSFAPEGKQICPDAPWGDDSGRQIGYARQEHGMKPSPAQFKLGLYQRIARHGPHLILRWSRRTRRSGSV
jgi:hypothetical protein